MANDHFVNWKDGKKPTKKAVERVIRQFFDSVATKIEWKTDRFFVDLIGKYSPPLEGLPGYFPAAKGEGRYIEVWLGPDSLDVMTRQADDFTNVCAMGLAQIFSRFWEGELDAD